MTRTGLAGYACCAYAQNGVHEINRMLAHRRIGTVCFNNPIID